ncbi:probable heme-binding protein 1 [Coccomyxa sp. Obi]|nr:probable heme-binding protein 1 [Coccomyxa sp. Obi]
MERYMNILLAVSIFACGAAASRPDVGDEARSSSKNIVSTGTAETLQPPYHTLQETDAYEEREYEEGDYAITNVTGSGFTVAYTRGISRLYAYFLGRNEDNVRMSRTQPSFTKMYPNNDFTDVVENNYTVSLWVPGHFQIDDFDDSHLWLAVYDPPTKITHRRNEVFLDACGKRHIDNQIIEQPSTVFAKLHAIYEALFG